MKAHDKVRKEAVSSLISAVKKAAIDAGCRDDIPESMVDQVDFKRTENGEGSRVGYLSGFQTGSEGRVSGAV